MTSVPTPTHVGWEGVMVAKKNEFIKTPHLGWNKINLKKNSVFLSSGNMFWWWL